ncbi:MAG: type II secretion system protein J [bacterium]
MSSNIRRVQDEPSDRASEDGGFTLIELLVGIAVSSILLIGLFQLLSELTTLRTSYQKIALSSHRKAVLRRHLYQDLYSIPSSKVDFRGSTDELYRTAVTHTSLENSQEGMTLDTRVHYYTRRDESGLKLIREWKWKDLHDDYKESDVMLTAEKITFEYITETGGTVRSPSRTEGKIAGVKLTIDDSTLTIPVGVKETSDDGSSGKATPDR